MSVLFSDFALVAPLRKTLKDKYDLAVEAGLVFSGIDDWIVNEPSIEFEMCDFVGPGGFPAFFKEEDAKVCAELLGSNTIICRQERDGVVYWSVD